MKQSNSKRRGKKNPARTLPNNSYSQLTVPKSANSYSPVKLENTMKYVDEQIPKTNAGAQYVYWRMRMGDLFDPNPLILTGAISGFAELATLYRRYLVISLTVNIDIVNNEAFPVLVAIAPSDIDLASVITTPAAAVNLAEYPLAKKVLLSAAGGMNRAKLSMTINLPRFVGQPTAYLGSLDYSALVNASPTVQTFFNVAVSSATNFTALGVTQYATYKYRTVWSQRQTPNA